MQQENNTAAAEEQAPSYANTLGFRIIQQCDTQDMPDDIKGEIKEIMAKLSEVNPDDVESAVVVLRVKAPADAEGRHGFGLIVAAVGAQDLVMGSSLMLNEHLVNDMGGPGAMLASVLGGLAGPGCGDPNCEECGSGCDKQEGFAGIKVVVDNTVTGDPKEVAAAVEASCNGVGNVTKH